MEIGGHCQDWYAKLLIELVMGNLTRVREKSGNSISGNHIDKIILIIMI